MFHAGANAGNMSSGVNIVIIPRYSFSRLSQHWLRVSTQTV
jgi:hypothetical protein